MKKILCFLLIFLHCSIFAIQPTICLNMIVKDESPVIKRCLASVIPLVDYWVIVDTGSTDGTQEIIKEFMKDIPGELHEQGWVNFEHNRNQALQFAKGKGDYILLIDADEVLEFSKDFKLPQLEKDFYFIDTHFSGTIYKRVQLVNNHLDWKWTGVLHESIDSPQARSSDTLLGVVDVARPEGNRSQDPKKFSKDAQVLEKALETDPHHTRYRFYLAQSYKDGGEYEKAIENYQKRVAMQGFDQEVFWSLLQIGLMQEALKKPPAEVIESYKKAYAYRPSRAEPLYRLALYQRLQGNFEAAFEAASQGLSLKIPQDLLFVENWIYEHGLLLEYSVAAYWTNRPLEALIASNLLLSKPSLPENFKVCAENNLVWIYAKLAEAQAKAKAKDRYVTLDNPASQAILAK